MKAFHDLFPVAVFLIALVLTDLKTATAAIIVAIVLQVGWMWLRHRRVERIHLITLAVVLVLGGLTLVLDDVRFIKWKPTVVNWAFAAIMLGLQLATGKGALERMMGTKLIMPRHAWNKLNLSWALFFVVVGLLNLYVAFVYGTPADPLAGLYGGPIADEEVRDKHWGYFKAVGLMALTLVFAMVSFGMLSRHIEVPEEDAPGEANDGTGSK